MGGEETGIAISPSFHIIRVEVEGIENLKVLFQLTPLVSDEFE